MFNSVQHYILRIKYDSNFEIAQAPSGRRTFRLTLFQKPKSVSLVLCNREQRFLFSNRKKCLIIKSYPEMGWVA